MPSSATADALVRSFLTFYRGRFRYVEGRWWALHEGYWFRHGARDLLIQKLGVVARDLAQDPRFPDAVAVASNTFRCNAMVTAIRSALIDRTLPGRDEVPEERVEINPFAHLYGYEPPAAPSQPDSGPKVVA